MSQQPEPPACIADAVRHCLEQHHFAQKEETMHDLTRAVWDALVAEGELTNRCLQSLWASPNGQRRDLWLPVLVIPLPVVETRDATHLTTGGSA